MTTRVTFFACSAITSLMCLMLAPVFAADAQSGQNASALRMNDIQVVGSHNSFKTKMPSAVMTKLHAEDAKRAESLDYYHVTLSEQLDAGVRQFELDIFADPLGGRYADPKGEEWARAAGEGTGFQRAPMLKPGFKVLHNPDVDYLSSCATLIGCLSEIDRWSRAHPRHLPIMITLNAADTASGRPGITDPLPLNNKALLDALDAEIRSALPGDRLITPDEVRGTAPTLREAVRNKGWPSLAAARGRLYILFDVRPAVSEAYRAGHPSLAGRAMFGWYADDQAEGVIQIVQDPLVDGEKIKAWVKQGLIVRTRTDAGTHEARRKDYSKANAAIASGAQAVSTDYYPGAPDPLSLGFVITFSNGAMAQCNSVRMTNCANYKSALVEVLSP
jgi:Phosphoinositide phospholipase C, Ca2+-dependent